MMTSLILLSISLYLLTPSNANCGNARSNRPTLGIYIADITYGGTDDQIVGRIRYNNMWSEWRDLDHSNCDDQERGSINYFNIFEDITDEWEAVALFNCGDDGVAITGIEYWDGTKNKPINYFCDNVAGPSVYCYDGEVRPAKGECYKGVNDGYYETVWLDQDDRSCPGLNIATGQTLVSKGKKKTSVGKLYYQSNPGIPDICGSVSSHNSLVDQMLVVLDANSAKAAFIRDQLSMGIILIIVIACIMIYGIYKCVRKRQYDGYQRVNDQELKYGTLNAV